MINNNNNDNDNNDYDNVNNNNNNNFNRLRADLHKSSVDEKTLRARSLKKALQLRILSAGLRLV